MMPTQQHGNTLARSVRGGKTVKQVADIAGVSTDTIRRWVKLGLLHPRRERHGKLMVQVFTPKEVTKARLLARQTGRMSDRSASLRPAS